MPILSKKTQYVQITPIPSFIPRQLAIDFLHSHSEILELNPLTTGYEAIKAPRDAPADEFYSTWYEISQRIQYIPGAGKLGSGAIKFRGVFHDLPFGLQTHTYAPANVDLRNKWQICGNQPGEPPEPKELGSNAPPEGLYIREDVEIKCNVAMVSFVKKEMKAAAKIMLERLVKKAELLDKGELQAMMDDGRLRTVNPADRSAVAPGASPALGNQVPQLPGRQYSVSRPNGQGLVGSPYTQPPSPYQQNSSPNMQYASPNPQYAQPGQQYAPPGQQQYVPPQQLISQNNVVMELPGDYSYNEPQTPAGFLNINNNRILKRRRNILTMLAGLLFQRSPTWTHVLPPMLHQRLSVLHPLTRKILLLPSYRQWRRQRKNTKNVKSARLLCLHQKMKRNLTIPVMIIGIMHLRHFIRMVRLRGIYRGVKIVLSCD